MMKDLNIPLGERLNDLVEDGKVEKSDKYYPSVHVDSDKPIDLPQKGQLLVTFKKVRSEEVHTEDKTKYCCTLEIHSLDGVEADKGSPMPRPDEVFDKAMEAYMKTKGEKA